MHLDHEVAAKSEFGKPLVNSVFTFGLMVGVSVADTTLGTLVANLGYDKLVFPNPVFVGDTLRSESECIAVRESKSRPNAGIVTWAHRSFNQRDELVCECTRTALLLKKPRMTEPRSWLFVPADSEKKIAKALDSDADAIIFDLEDSVAPAQKAAAREILEGTCRRARAARQWWVRINPLGSEHHKDDLDADRHRRHPRHRPAQGRKRRRRHPARAPHRQHPDPRHRHRDRGQPVRPAQLSRPQLAAGGDELGRRGSVGGARRLVQI